MPLTLTITRRSAVIATATTLAIGGAFAIGLTGSNATPTATAGTYQGSYLGDRAVPAADSTAMAPDAFPGITVEGVGKVTGTPDTLVLSLAATKTAPDVSAAISELSGTMTAVQSSLTSHGVAAADMQTSGLSVNPQYDYSNSGKPTLSGYEATESLTAKIHDLKGAGATISAASDAGGNSTRINGLSFDLQNNGALLNGARDAAFADAKNKAAQYAKSAGRTLGAVVRVEEGTPSTVQSTPYPMAAGAAASKDSAAPVPIQAGSTDVSVTVTVVFAFA